MVAEADAMIEAVGIDYGQYVDMAGGVIDRVIFSDPEIYERELEQIFARAWNFMCHESQIPKPGDFFCNFIGEESVIATRDRTGKLQVFLNTCRHRGNAVCRADSGHASAFMCTYHGWTYGLDGKLKGVPGYRDFYHAELDKDQWVEGFSTLAGRERTTLQRRIRRLSRPWSRNHCHSHHATGRQHHDQHLSALQRCAGSRW